MMIIQDKSMKRIGENFGIFFSFMTIQNHIFRMGTCSMDITSTVMEVVKKELVEEQQIHQG